MTVIQIDGIIGWDVIAADVRKAIREANGSDLTIEVNSPGGLVTEGIAIYNAIKNAPGKKITKITGIAASMGSYIALASDRVMAEANAIFMIHNASLFAGGDHNALRKAADIAEGMSKILATAYVDKTGKSASEIKKMMDAETFLYGDEIRQSGFADETIGVVTDDKMSAVLKTRAAVASADDIIRRVTTEQDADQAAACLVEVGALAKNNIEEEKSVQSVAQKQKGEVRKMTKEQVIVEAPEVAQALRDDGVQAERNRVKGLVAWRNINADADKIVEEAIASGANYADVAAQLGAAVARGRKEESENPATLKSSTPQNAGGAQAQLEDQDAEAAAMFGMTVENYRKYAKKGGE